MNELKETTGEKIPKVKSKNLFKIIVAKIKDLADLFKIPRHDDEIGVDKRSTTERAIEKTGEMYHHDIEKKEKDEKILKDWKEKEK